MNTYQSTNILIKNQEDFLNFLCEMDNEHEKEKEQFNELELDPFLLLRNLESILHEYTLSGPQRSALSVSIGKLKSSMYDW